MYLTRSLRPKAAVLALDQRGRIVQVFTTSGKVGSIIAVSLHTALLPSTFPSPPWRVRTPGVSDHATANQRSFASAGMRSSEHHSVRVACRSPHITKHRVNANAYVPHRLRTLHESIRVWHGFPSLLLQIPRMMASEGPTSAAEAVQCAVSSLHRCF